LAVVIGLQVYAITKNPFALGILGLVEAIPAVTLALFGGHVADRSDRRRIVLTTQAIAILCAVAFAVVSSMEKAPPLEALYGIVFVAGLARGFLNPAATAFEAQVVPREHFVNAAAWSSSIWQFCAIGGPALAGFAYAGFGAATTYAIIAGFLAIAWTCVSRIAPRPVPQPNEHESIFESIRTGLRFVFRSQPLVGSMALDLFAVLFGGAMALLPVFGTEILKVGPVGVGILRAAPSVGALVIMLWSTRRPPIAHAGRNLLFSVAGFGVSMIVFGLSKNLLLSAVALAFSGAFDGVSMVIRGAILRLLTPDHLRGRVSSVSWVFIGSSNEIGAFESGLAASWLGTARSVYLGGIVTLIVVASTAIFAPGLRKLQFDPYALKEVGPPDGEDEVMPDLI